MNKFKVNIQGMTCTGCEKHVESALKKIGAKNIESNFRRGEAVFELPDDIEVESAINDLKSKPNKTMKDKDVLDLLKIKLKQLTK